MTPFEKMIAAILGRRDYGRTAEECAIAAICSLQADGWVKVPKTFWSNQS